MTEITFNDLPDDWDEDYKKLYIDRERIHQEKRRYRKALHFACNGDVSKVVEFLELADDGKVFA